MVSVQAFGQWLTGCIYEILFVSITYYILEDKTFGEWLTGCIYEILFVSIQYYILEDNKEKIENMDFVICFLSLSLECESAVRPEAESVSLIHSSL